MKNEMKLPKPIEIYIKAVNAHDHDTFESSFALDAVVKDAGGKFAASLRSDNGPISRSSPLTSRSTLWT